MREEQRPHISIWLKNSNNENHVIPLQNETDEEGTYKPESEPYSAII